MTESLQRRLRQLRLSGLASALDVRLQEAAGHNLSHLEFLELILQDEFNIRGQRRLARRKKWADFRDARTLEDFDFSFNPSVKRKQIYDLAAGQFGVEHGALRAQVRAQQAALDQACVDACMAANPMPNSQLSDNMKKPGFADWGDPFRNSRPESEWRSCLEHAEKIGLGTREYELIKM